MYIQLKKMMGGSILLLLTFLIVVVSNTKPSLDSFCAFILINVVTVIVIVYDKQQPFNLFTIFVILLALFHFGQVLLHAFSLPINTSNAYDLFSLYSEKTLLNTLMYCLIVFDVIALVGYITVNISKDKYIYKQEREFLSDGANVYYFGKVMFWVLLVPIILFDITMVTSGIALGYKARYTYPYPLLSDLDTYFPFAIICLIIGGSEDRQWKGYYGYALFRMLIQMFTVGNRSSLIISFILYEIARQTFQVSHKQKLRSRILYIGAIVAICVMISFIAVIRGGDRITLNVFFEEYNVFSLFFSEFGSTLITPILAGNYVETFGNVSGKNYLGALSVLLPRSSVYFSDIRSYMNVGAMLNPYSPSEGALGGSLIADMIMGFQSAGIFIAFPLGILVGKVSKTIAKLKNRGFIQCAVLYLSYGLLLYVRGNAEDVTLAAKRTIYIAIAYLGYRYVVKVFRGKEKEGKQDDV